VDEIDYDDRDFVESEIEQAKEGIFEAKTALQKLAYDDAEVACALATEAITNLSGLVATRGAARNEAQSVYNEVKDTLYNVSYGYDDFSDRTSEEESCADTLRSELSEAMNSKQYDVVVSKAEEAGNLIAGIETRKAHQAETEALLKKHAEAEYAKTDFYESSYHPELDQVVSSIYDDNEFFDGLNMAINESENGYLVVTESRLNEKRILWLEASVYRRDEIEFHLRSEKGLYLTEADLDEIEVVDLWTPPSEEEVRLSNLRSRRETYQDEVERAEADVRSGYSRKLQFRQGKHPKTDEEQWEASGGKGIKFVVDWNSYLIPEAGRWYYCSDVKTVVDLATFKLIAVDPYLEADLDLDAEIVKLEVELYGEEAVVESEEEEVVEGKSDKEVSDEPSVDLADLLDAWGANK
jgi:hypothetical protein